MSQDFDARRERIWAILDSLKDKTLTEAQRERLEAELSRLGQLFDPECHAAPGTVEKAFAWLEKWDANHVPDFNKIYRRKTQLDRKFFGR